MKVIISQSANFAELQSQFSSPNCIYVIGIEQQTFGTSTSPLVIPENSTLIFEGGKLIGGYVKLNNTVQNDVYYKVWDNVKISSVFEYWIHLGFRNTILRPEWFGAIGDGVHDDTKALQQCIDLASSCGAIVELATKRYLITETIHILSGTHIKGTLPGSIDRSVHTGTSINVKLKSGNVALDLNSGYEEAGVKKDPSGCYKFILENFSIIKDRNEQSVSAIRLYSEDFLCPRSGLIDSVNIYGFTIGLELRALSYVKFSRMSIVDCDMCIYINKTGEFVEFGWFYNISTSTIADDAIGIKIESGNNLFFNEIDINGCKYGFWLNAIEAIYNMFVDKINFVECVRSIWFYAFKQHITRVKISGVTTHNIVTETNGCGILFSRNSYFTIENCVFTDLFDAQDKEIDYIKIEEISMDSCTFDRIRTNNKLVGFSRVKKIGVLTMPNSGEFIIPSGTSSSYNYIVTTRSPIDFNPIVLTIPQGEINITSVSNNVQKGNLSINVFFSGTLQQNLHIRYFFPQL